VDEAEVTCRVVDPEGLPMPDVAVSDGAAVAVTDATGAASLPGGDRPFVWVSRPSGFDAAPWFVRRTDRVAEPGTGTGSDADREADRADRDEVTFTLSPVDQSLPMTFGQITDLHLSDAPEPASLPLADSLYGLDADGTPVGRPLTSVGDLASVLEEVAAAEGPLGPPRFLVATGDLTDHGKVTEFAMLAEALASSPLPVHLLPGNHDHYGHHHEPRPDDAPLDSHGMGTGTTTRYEDEVGPRWWSLSHGGLRLVAIDWFSHRLGLDTELQEAWLAADLATAPPGTPVLVLAHDQLPEAFFDRLAAASPHVRLLGSLSGHWHTSRVVRIAGQLHANTGNATFGSFDWAPAHGRLVGWDGEALTLRTVAIGGGESLASSTFASGPGPALAPDAAVWSTRLPGAAHLARPILVGDGSVVVTWSDDDTAAGGLSCHDVATGALRWRADLDAPVKAGATWLADLDAVVGVSVSGGVVAVDARTGERRWSRQVGEAMVAWVHAAPVPVGDAVVVGEVRTFAALDGRDGTVRWWRDDLDNAENASMSMQGVTQDGTLVMGFSLVAQHTQGIDPVTGLTRWSGDGSPYHAPSSDVVADPGGLDVYLNRLGGRVERIAAATGERRWAAGVRAAFLTGRPLLVDESVVVTSALGVVHRFEAATGTEVWRTELAGERLLAMGPYRREGPAVPAGATRAGGGIVQVAGDGRVHHLDLSTGAAEVVTTLGAPITAPALAVGSDAIVATTEGSLVRIAL
jgi:outer membrane protein assembly factor BamB